jgi:glycosyltransferase involved in cell wall biosynthesis
MSTVDQRLSAERTAGVRPRVSVVIATYNRAGMVGTAIRSVLDQTHADLELVVVDDCSPDDTRRVVQAIHDPRVRYLRHPSNRGLPAGRNTGIRAARGEFVAFLDDDDTWRPTKLERQLKAVEGADAVLCGAVIEGRGVKTFERVQVTCARLRRGNRFDPSSLLVRTSVIADVGFDESLRFGEDWDAFIRIAERGAIAYLPEPLLVYNDGGHQRMTNEGRFTAIDLQDRLRVLDKHRGFFGEYWYRYHCADNSLSYISSRSGRATTLLRTARRHGARPVAHVLASRVAARMSAVRNARRHGGRSA